MDSGNPSESLFKVDSFENTIGEIQKETEAQHSMLKELRARHQKLKEDLQKKGDTLQSCKNKKMNVIEELKLEEFRVKELEEKYQTELELTEGVRKEVKKIQDQLQAEKANQIESLKIYENKMAVLAQCFREGPTHYSRKVMMQKMKNLENISAGLKKEIGDNQMKINDCLQIFKKIAKDGAMFNGSTSVLLKEIGEEVNQIGNIEIPVLKTALKSLENFIDERESDMMSTTVKSEE